MNAKFHKAQAEGLVKKVNGLADKIATKDDLSVMNMFIGLAQVHATLANVPDEED